MSYEKHTWETGEVITAEKLNNIEERAADRGYEYTTDYIVIEEGTATIDAQQTLAYKTPIQEDTIIVDIYGTSYEVTPTIEGNGTIYVYGGPPSSPHQYPFLVVGTSNGNYFSAYSDTEHSSGTTTAFDIKFLSTTIETSPQFELAIKETVGPVLTGFVDGNADGSIRGKYTATEDANYSLGLYAVAEGNRTKATGEASHAEGVDTSANSQGCHVEGNSTKASAFFAHAEGGGTVAKGAESHAEGWNTTTIGEASHAEGRGTTASGPYSHAEGWGTTANGNSTHAEGNYTKAIGIYSHAEGYGASAQCKSQHVFGEYNIEDTGSAIARGTYVEIVGNGTGTNARSNARTLDWSGNESLQGSLTLGKGTADETTITAAQLKALIALLNS